MAESEPRARCQRGCPAFDPTKAESAGNSCYRNSQLHDYVQVQCPTCRSTVYWRRCGCTGMQMKALEASGKTCPKGPGRNL